ncbi:MAG TPA: tetratricopeptide repeat protein [Tepidisphaeraceae bacterium]|nr:tetratricopeptide repeat protein [Tepidisphaeraceae bacterium]
MTTPQALELAISHHQAGRLDEAQVLCRQILTNNPQDANVLHLLGVLASQAGRFDEGAEFIQRAIAVLPNFAGFHFNPGETYRRQGKPDLAVAALLRATQLDPRMPDAHRGLSAALADLRSNLREIVCMSPLMNPARFARDMESLYRQMWQTHCSRK